MYTHKPTTHTHTYAQHTHMYLWPLMATISIQRWIESSVKTCRRQNTLITLLLTQKHLNHTSTTTHTTPTHLRQTGGGLGDEQHVTVFNWTDIHSQPMELIAISMATRLSSDFHQYLNKTKAYRNQIIVMMLYNLSKFLQNVKYVTLDP